MGAEVYFNMMAELLGGVAPPAKADAPILAEMAKIGIVPGQQFEMSDLDPAVQAAIKDVPQVVLDTALQACSLMGDGFYGVDIKHIDGKALVIEVNDNPSVDAGVEDELIGDELYLAIMRHLLNKLDENRQNASKSEATATV